MDTRVIGDRATKDMGLAFPFPACSKLVTHQIIDIVEVAKFVLIIVIVIVIVVHRKFDRDEARDFGDNTISIGFHDILKHPKLTFSRLMDSGVWSVQCSKFPTSKALLRFLPLNIKSTHNRIHTLFS